MTAIETSPGVEPVTTVERLLGMLPADVRARIESDPASDLARFKPTAAAARVMATIRDPRIWHHVSAANIDWKPLLADARCYVFSPSVAVRLELAAGLAGYDDARPLLCRAAVALDPISWAAFLDALRIAQEGLAP